MKTRLKRCILNVMTDDLTHMHVESRNIKIFKISHVRCRELVCCCCCVASVVSDSVQPHKQQPTRLLHPRDSPGKNAGVGRHFFLQCMKVKSESEVAQLCLTLCDSMNCSQPGSSIHGSFQARALE